MARLSEKTTAILNCMPYLDELVSSVFAIAVLRGFSPEGIHDVEIDEELITFKLVHRFHRSLSSLIIVEISFKELTLNPHEYIKEMVKQENRRYANDNQIQFN